MKLNKLALFAILCAGITESVFAVSSTLCTITSGSTLATRKGVKAYLTKNGKYLTAIPTTDAGWTGVTIKLAKNTDANYEKALLVTYTHKAGNIFSSFSGLLKCDCDNSDIPATIKTFCKSNKLNSTQGRVLALGKSVRGATKQVGAAVTAAKKDLQTAATQAGANLKTSLKTVRHTLAPKVAKPTAKEIAEGEEADTVETTDEELEIDEGTAEEQAAAEAELEENEEEAE